MRVVRMVSQMVQVYILGANIMSNQKEKTITVTYIVRKYLAKEKRVTSL